VIELIVRVALALLAAHDYTANDGSDAAFHTMTPEWQEVYMNMARAAIEAMREPTEAMLDASWTTCIRRPAADYIATELASPRDAHRHKTRIRHRAMIDASLHEGEAQR